MKVLADAGLTAVNPLRLVGRASLPPQGYPLVAPATPTLAGQKHAQRSPDLLQRMQLHSLMKWCPFGA